VKVKWTHQARRDLAAIHDYIAADSPFYAAQVVNTILETEHEIAAQPLAGSMIRERARRDIRQVKRYSWRIIYRIKARTIDVLTIVHSKRDLKSEQEAGN
jgi:addiction module RelE/StbE family toxin